MNEPSGTSGQPDTKGKPLPPPYTHVQVRCKGFRCQAYRDSDGKWRSASTREELPEVLEVYWEP